MENYPKPNWKVRRRIIYCTLLFCVFCVLWVLLSNDTRPVMDVIVICSYGLGFATIGSYVFGAVWDDKNYMRTLKPNSNNITSDTWQPPNNYQDLG